MFSEDDPTATQDSLPGRILSQRLPPLGVAVNIYSEARVAAEARRQGLSILREHLWQYLWILQDFEDWATSKYIAVAEALGQPAQDALSTESGNHILEMFGDHRPEPWSTATHTGTCHKSIGGRKCGLRIEVQDGRWYHVVLR